MTEMKQIHEWGSELGQEKMFMVKSSKQGCAWGHWQRFISIPVIRGMRRKDPPGSFALVYAADEKERFVPGVVWITHHKA